MDGRSTLSILAEELGKLLAPFGQALTSPQDFSAFMRELGWDFQVLPMPLEAFATPLQAIEEGVQQFASDPSEVQNLIELLKSFFSLLEGLKNLPPALFPPTIDINEFKNDFPGQIVQFLVIEYLENEHPNVGYFLKTMGAIRERHLA